MILKKNGHHNGLALVLISSFVLLLVLQDSPARTRVSSNDDDPGYRVKKSGRPLTSAAGEDFKQLLEEAKKLYNEMDYEAAIQKLKSAQGMAKTAMQKADLYFYLSLAYYATLSGRDRSELQDAIEKVFVYDYQREPDADLCPSGYIDIFNELKESYGAIKIDSQPRGADVYINRSLEGKTPLTIGAKAGPINILIKKGKVEKQDQLDVTAGEVMSSPIYELAGKKGKFPIAIVLGGVAVAGGAAAFLLKGGGGGNGGDKTGSIQVSSSPTGAKIYLDGVDTGKVTDATLTSVSAGSHTVKLTKDGYSDKEQSVTVTAGQTATVNLTLTKDTITVTMPAAGTIWTLGSSVTISWQVSAGSSLQSQPIVAGPSPAGLQNEYRFNAQFSRASRDLADLGGMGSGTSGRSERSKSLVRGKSIQELQGIQNPSATPASGSPRRVSREGFSLSLNRPLNSSLRRQMNDTVRVLAISNVKIELYKGSTLTSTIAQETENDGSQGWQVPTTLSSGSDYRVRVSCASDTGVYGESDPFTIGTTAGYEFVSKWGSFGSGNGQFNYPIRLAVGSSANIFVVDNRNQRIQKFNSNGSFLTKWGSWGAGDGEFYYPVSVAVDRSEGSVYVVDAGNDRIQKFTQTGNFLTKWGSKGTGNGQFNSPEDIAVDSSGNVYVVDYWNFRIQKFSPTGSFLTKWGSEGTGDGQFKSPEGIAVDSPGNVYVADSGNHRIQKFNSQGTFLGWWGRDDQGFTGWHNPGSGRKGTSGGGDGQLYSPGQVAVDSHSDVYVADASNQRIQKFTATGSFLVKWGTFGIGNGEFDLPLGVAVDNSGYVYVADSQNNRIQKFRKVG